ncbi:alpha-glucosidase [Pseudalkalibacillus decolorationis]|uniref:alpha-glucosidase n=1 Tax=Pseudalkalibacillus decolorationis TaxID=163879 RepID=UPI0021477F45|nr:alpha-glucosidase [Pseudalkalibacillus decolorationis]
MSATTSVTAFNVIEKKEGFEVRLDGRLVFEHSMNRPFIFVGSGEETIDMYRGNFKFEDYLIERVPLRYAAITNLGDSYEISFRRFSDDKDVLSIHLGQDGDALKTAFHLKDKSLNRFWIRVTSDKEEKVYGCGEQLSYFNMRGKNFPLWTSEPGVGRNKNTYTTWQADVKDQAGGDYYNTNFPQPTFISTNKYFCHVETTAYADFDFRHEDFHELQIWGIPSYILFEGAPTYKKLVNRLTARLGRQPELPDWTYNGIWLGIQGGTDLVEEKLERSLKKGLKVGAVWCQDWQGKRVTSFGKRLMWNWQWNPEEYPNLDKKIHEWKEQGIRFLGYINPYVVKEGHLYKEAKQNGFLAMAEDGGDYLVDFGEFYCGVVDFTNEEAYRWYKSVIKDNLIDFGLDGWMADFGEYLPTDLKLSNGKPATIMHNAWPALWAKVNHDAVKEAGRWGDIVYFMRAGYTGIQATCPLLWAGDQSVNWSLDDGLASVIPAALSAGMTGCGIHHSDIGGYTSLHGNKRTKELLLRWVDMAAFTPVMRTHEGNRPDDCFQYDGDDETLDHFVKMTNVYVTLAPYMKMLVKQNAEEGIPVQRPLFMEYEKDVRSYDIQYQYLLGTDILVAPVHEEGKTTWKVYLPEDDWVHFWSGEAYKGGDIEVDAPIGQPPVFYRKTSSYRELFVKAAQESVGK